MSLVPADTVLGIDNLQYEKLLKCREARCLLDVKGSILYQCQSHIALFGKISTTVDYLSAVFASAPSGESLVPPQFIHQPLSFVCILSLHQEPDPDATQVEMESRCFHVVVEVLGLGGEPLPVFQMSLVEIEDLYEDIGQIIAESEQLWDSLDCYSILMHSILPAHVVHRMHSRLMVDTLTRQQGVMRMSSAALEQEMAASTHNGSSSLELKPQALLELLRRGALRKSHGPYGTDDGSRLTSTAGYSFSSMNRGGSFGLAGHAFSRGHRAQHEASMAERSANMQDTGRDSTHFRERLRGKSVGSVRKQSGRDDDSIPSYSDLGFMNSLLNRGRALSNASYTPGQSQRNNMANNLPRTKSSRSSMCALFPYRLTPNSSFGTDEEAQESTGTLGSMFDRMAAAMRLPDRASIQAKTADQEKLAAFSLLQFRFESDPDEVSDQGSNLEESLSPGLRRLPHRTVSAPHAPLTLMQHSHQPCNSFDISHAFLKEDNLTLDSQPRFDKEGAMPLAQEMTRVSERIRLSGDTSNELCFNLQERAQERLLQILLESGSTSQPSGVLNNNQATTRFAYDGFTEEQGTNTNRHSTRVNLLTSTNPTSTNARVCENLPTSKNMSRVTTSSTHTEDSILNSNSLQRWVKSGLDSSLDAIVRSSANVESPLTFPNGLDNQGCSSSFLSQALCQLQKTEDASRPDSTITSAPQLNNSHWYGSLFQHTQCIPDLADGDSSARSFSDFSSSTSSKPLRSTYIDQQHLGKHDKQASGVPSMMNDLGMNEESVFNEMLGFHSTRKRDVAVFDSNTESIANIGDTQISEYRDNSMEHNLKCRLYGLNAATSSSPVVFNANMPAHPRSNTYPSNNLKDHQSSQPKNKPIDWDEPVHSPSDLSLKSNLSRQSSKTVQLQESSATTSPVAPPAECSFQFSLRSLPSQPSTPDYREDDPERYQADVPGSTLQYEDDDMHEVVMGLSAQTLLPLTTEDLAKLSTFHPQVSLLFSDIKGFTHMCSQVDELKIMYYLNILFTLFDTLVKKWNCYKVETVGDAYVVASGLMTESTWTRPMHRSTLGSSQEDNGLPPTARKNGLTGFKPSGIGKTAPLRVPAVQNQEDPGHARRSLLFAIEAMQCATQVQNPLGEPTSMRFGLHSGSVSSGVIGLVNPRFCLFGDTMNMASRMENTGEPGCIHVSAGFAMSIPEVPWLARETFVKGKGQLRTYLFPRTGNLRMLKAIIFENMMATVPPDFPQSM